MKMNKSAAMANAPTAAAEPAMTDIGADSEFMAVAKIVTTLKEDDGGQVLFVMQFPLRQIPVRLHRLDTTMSQTEPSMNEVELLQRLLTPSQNCVPAAQIPDVALAPQTVPAGFVPFGVQVAE